jgi:hypothetical protein
VVLIDEQEAREGSMHTPGSHVFLALQEALMGAALLFQLMFTMGGPVSRCAAPAQQTEYYRM